MIVAFLIIIITGILNVLLLPLVGLTIAGTTFMTAISGWVASAAPWVAAVGNFCDLSTVAICFSVVIGLELVIKVWELFTTFVLRK